MVLNCNPFPTPPRKESKGFGQNKDISSPIVHVCLKGCKKKPKITPNNRLKLLMKSRL